MVPAQAQGALIGWYLQHRRDLPWRQTRDPYRILVSEIMLQQTQAERVVPKYHEFLRLFPSVEALADAPASEVIRAWAGLGYNRRALNLQRACRAVVERFEGLMPDSVADLLSLPGVGPYTAGAIACFAFEQDVGFVDTNIRRVLHRLVLGPEIPTPMATTREIDALAARVVPAGRGYEWNQALMELGATVCRARSTECERCPVTEWCVSSGMMQGSFAARVVKRPGKAIPFEHTSRYFRGRIIDRLRDAPLRGLTARELALAIDSERDPGEPAWTCQFLSGLSKDGLVVSSKVSGGVREDSALYDDAESLEPERFRLPD